MVFAPTGTGKTSFIKKMVHEEVTSFRGHRGNLISSTVVSLRTNERFVMSEGGFWGWLLCELKHLRAGNHIGPLQGRFLVYEFVKDLASRSPAGRILFFIDEAQKLGIEELGLLADLVDELQRSGFRLVVFLVGSYDLAHWKEDLRTNRYSNVRRRFFSKEHRLLGLSVVDDYRRCLRRYDVDSTPFNGKSTITEHYQTDWYRGGGRLELYASLFRAAFAEAIGNPQSFQVGMAFFSLTLKKILEQSTVRIDRGRLKDAVEESGFAFNYEPDATL